ncbi:MAG: hypothetical protein ABIN67_07265 [Ferruginibacter sp.]
MKVSSLILLMFIAGKTIAQQNYWEKADAKYNSDYRERIRANMYIKPSTYKPPVTITQSQSSNASNNSFSNRQDASEARYNLLKQQAADRAKALAELPALREKVRQNDLMNNFLVDNGITNFEAQKIVNDINYYDRKLNETKDVVQRNYYQKEREKRRERLYIGDYKKLFLENSTTLSYDSLNKIINIMTFNNAPLTAFELLNKLIILYPNRLAENDALQVNIYQELFGGFLDRNLLDNGLLEKMASSYLEFENYDIEIYYQMLSYCAEHSNGITPYESIISAAKDLKKCGLCSRSEKKEADKYYEVYSKRQKVLNERVLFMLSGSNPANKAEQQYINKIAKGLFGGSDIIYLPLINRTNIGLKKTAAVMQVTPTGLLKKGGGLTMQQSTDFLYELAYDGDDEALELMNIIQHGNETFDIKFKFLKSKKWDELLSKRISEGSKKAKEFLR